ncbi:pilus assembly protein [Undibacterium sp. Tian12W]|uniref:pilus assembly protein n=1 Tax=Undibacterium sp. Tian12W TaxID=3413054 RepID=UPI003BF37F23
MKKINKSLIACMIGSLIGQLIAPGLAYATISNAPPLVKPNVPPNIFYTLDDSGSMMWEMMPDDIPRTGNGDVTGTGYDDYCGGCWVTNVFPKPANLYNVGGAGDYGIQNSIVVGFNNNITVARWRSSDVNKAYYDPKVLYQPWADPNGGLMAPANPLAALYNPVAPSGGTNTNTINLSINQTFPAGVYGWLNDAATAYDTNSRTIFPALYYVYKGTSGCNLSTLTCFDRYEIKAGTTFPAKAPARTDCALSACTVTEELQNFANWFQYHRSRILTARGGSGQAFSKQNSTIRVGFGTINTNGTVINKVSNDFSATNKTNFLNTLYKQRMPAAGTPLRKAVDEVGQYFKDTSITGPWQTTSGVGLTSTQLTCRQNYNILMTDGYWNGTAAGAGRNGNYDGANGPTMTRPDGSTYQYTPAKPYTDTFSNTLADIAFYYWANDLRPDWTAAKKNVPTTGADPAFWQHLTQFTVGLGVKGTLDPSTDLPALTSGAKVWPDGSTNQIDDLWHAAVNSRGKYFSASNPTEFAAALDSSLNTIAERVGDAAAVGTSSNTVRAGSSIFTSTYRTSDWSGQLVQRLLNDDGEITGNGWTATVPDFLSRQNRVFTYIDPVIKGKVFNYTNLALADQAYFDTEASTYPATTVTGANIVNYIIGGPDLNRLRPRTVPFGDFVNSAPQYVKEGDDSGYSFLPAGTDGKTSYGGYLLTKYNRTPMVYIGSNDGMLHAINGTTGVEEFAYVPKAVMSNLPLLSRTTYGHRFFVDGTPAVGDYYDNGWKTALVGTTGAGGRAVFAMDVTVPTLPTFGPGKILWEINSTTQAELGYTIGTPQIGRMPNGDWVAVVGNGYESFSKHAQLFIIRLVDGAVTRVDTGVGSTGAPNGLATPRLVVGADATIKAIFAGDIQGNLWKFDVKNSGTTVAFSGNPLFQAKIGSVVQPITVQPDIMPHNRGGIVVLFGTGKIYETEDALTTDVQSLYGVWDQTGATGVSSPDKISGSQSALQRHTLSWSGPSAYGLTNETIDWSSKRGWFVDLNLSTGERLTIDPQVFFDEVVMTTIIPASAVDTCSSDGKSTTFILNALTGGVFPYPTFDTDGDKAVTSADALIAGKQAGLTFGSTLLKNGRSAIIYQPVSSGSGLSNNGTTSTNFIPSYNPTRRIWKQILRSD